jgi:hypothetical protein
MTRARLPAALPPRSFSPPAKLPRPCVCSSFLFAWSSPVVLIPPGRNPLRPTGPNRARQTNRVPLPPPSSPRYDSSSLGSCAAQFPPPPSPPAAVAAGRPRSGNLRIPVSTSQSSPLSPILRLIRTIPRHPCTRTRARPDRARAIGNETEMDGEVHDCGGVALRCHWVWLGNDQIVG